MKAVKSKDSKIELLLRKELWNRGHRYRKHYKKIPGKPDIVFVGKKVAVFCDSEFWHGKNWNERKKDFKSNKKFWHSKIERNIERDKEVNEILENLGWTVLRFWGNQIKQDLDRCVSLIEEKLRNNE
ncbi:MAG: very short patch repair endonuclease [Balneola sp.]|nr:very short patch repair endonuclease [Balneola sp.]MBO6649787.1 very short patch repair endonuclease [Balneola sp.]MBO6712350.1 very short patch repair endonuclease [Balneola sp.]